MKGGRHGPHRSIFLFLNLIILLLNLEFSVVVIVLFLILVSLMDLAELLRLQSLG